MSMAYSLSRSTNNTRLDHTEPYGTYQTFAAKRIHRTAQGFNPGLYSEKSALKVATETRLWAVRALFTATPTSDATFRASFTNRQPRIEALGCSVQPLRDKVRQSPPGRTRKGRAGARPYRMRTGLGRTYIGTKPNLVPFGVQKTSHGVRPVINLNRIRNNHSARA
jgi:hypothetical protein